MERGEALSLAELSRGLDMSKSLVFRVLRELKSRHFVEEVEAGKYWLGIQALAIGAAFAADRTHSSVTAPILSELAAETGAETWLGVLRGSQMVAIMGFGGQDAAVRASYIGARLPANCTSMGKALLATYSDAEVRELLGEDLTGLTPRSIVEIDLLLEDLERTRQRGYAVQEDEAVTGSSGLATVVSLQLPNATQASISVSTESGTFAQELDSLLDALVRATERFAAAAASAVDTNSLLDGHDSS